MTATTVLRWAPTLSTVYVLLVGLVNGGVISSEPTRLGCGPNEYRCTNSQCIASTNVCNDIDDCDDGSDETDIACQSIRYRSPITRNQSIPRGPTQAPSVMPVSSKNASSRTFFADTSRQDSGGIFGSSGWFAHNPHKDDTSSNGGSVLGIMCSAPPQPKNGRWEREVTGVIDRLYFGLDIVFKPGRRLRYSCNPGYKLSGPEVVHCDNSGRWSERPVCTVIQCPSLASESRLATCYRFDNWTSCDSPILPNTTAQLRCQIGYEKHITSTDASNLVKCNEFGEWTPHPIECRPDCGLLPDKKDGRVYNASAANVADFPWHVSLYKEMPSPNGANKHSICGGTIISAKIVMTAAHCVYDEATRRSEDPGKLFVMTGNIFNEWNSSLHDTTVVRKAPVKSVHVHCQYFGFEGNYAADIALLELTVPFQVSIILMPACLWKRDGHALQADSYGKVAGFGKTETASSSANLRTITVPYVPFNECHSRYVNTIHEVFMTLDKFCAGYTNGTAVCDGDSGGGLVFEKSGLWYVEGIVSVGLGVDTSGGTKSCNRYSYTLYTAVRKYIGWIRDVMDQLQRNGTYSACNTPSS